MQENKVTSHNFYKIPLESKSELINHLKDRLFFEKPLKQTALSKKALIELYFCEKENVRGLQWIKTLNAYTEDELECQSYIYGAVVLYSNDTFCYAESFGNAHFYLTQFCDHTFGLSAAERLVDLNNVKAQQNLSHGSRLNRSHIDYTKPIPISFSSGDVPVFIQGNTICKEDWGKNMICGFSAIQFRDSESPVEIVDKLIKLDQILVESPKESLPQLIPLHPQRDSKKIESLYSDLCNSISTCSEDYSDGSISIPSFYLAGTKLVQSDFEPYMIKCGYKSMEIQGDFNMEDILRFWNDNGFEVSEALIKTYIVNENTPRTPLLEILEYVHESKCCLRNGKWYEFNKTYINNLLLSISKVAFSNHIDDDYVFNKPNLVTYAESNGFRTSSNPQPYETYYNNFLSSKFSLNCIHPNTHKFESSDSRRLEVCDLYDQNTLYFVKIGGPSDFAQAIDQAMRTLDRVKHDNGKLFIDDCLHITPTEIRLILVYSHDKKKKPLKSLSDVKSLNFLVHLSDLKQQAKLSELALNIDFVYEFVSGVNTPLLAS